MTVVDVNNERISAWNSDALPIFEVDLILYLYNKLKFLLAGIR